MVELILCLILAPFLWVTAVKWSRALDGWLALEEQTPTAEDVADVEHDFPELRDVYDPTGRSDS